MIPARQLDQSPRVSTSTNSVLKTGANASAKISASQPFNFDPILFFYFTDERENIWGFLKNKQKKILDQMKLKQALVCKIDENLGGGQNSLVFQLESNTGKVRYLMVEVAQNDSNKHVVLYHYFKDLPSNCTIQNVLGCSDDFALNNLMRIVEKIVAEIKFKGNRKRIASLFNKSVLCLLLLDSA